MDVVADPTDQGTDRPNLPFLESFGTSFYPTPVPPKNKVIKLPVSSTDAFATFSLFFPPEQLQIIANHTNFYALKKQE